MNKVLFMVLNGEVRFNMSPNADPKEWFKSFGLNEALYETIVRGFVLDNKIIFFKGSEFKYDEEVIKAAKTFTPYIRFSLQKQTLEVYCGITIMNSTTWEPILKIQENEITGIEAAKPITQKNNSPSEAQPFIEIKNNYEDEKFRKTAILVTLVVLGITVLTKIILFSIRGGLSTRNFSDILLALAQIGLLGFTVIGHLKKKIYTKYLGIASSLLLIFTFHIVDLIIGILYFLFCIDQHYFELFIELVKKIIKKIQKKRVGDE